MDDDMNEVDRRRSEALENQSKLMTKEKELKELREELGKTEKSNQIRREEMESLKKRILEERRRVNDEYEKFNFNRGDVDIRMQELLTKEDYIKQERKVISKEASQLKQKLREVNDDMQAQ